jgi:hypothetical protein
MAFPTTAFLDDFNRSDRSLNGDEMSSRIDSWAATCRIFSTDLDGEIVSNLFRDSGNNSARGQTSYDRLAAGVSRGVEVWGTINQANITAGTHCRLWWAIADPNTATPDGYFLKYSRELLELSVVRVDNGVETQLGAAIAQTLGSGDKLGIWHEDDGSGTIHIYKKVDGSDDEFVEVATRTDTTYDAGFLGLAISQTAAGQWILDDFGGGLAAPALVTVTDPIVRMEVVHFDKSVAAAPTTQTVPATISPEGLCLMGTRQTAYGDAVEMNHFFGVATSQVHQWGIWAGAENGSATAEVHAQKVNAPHVLELYDINTHTGGPDSGLNAPTVLSQGDLDAFLTNSFRLSYPDDNNAEDVKCHALLWRGIRRHTVVQEDFNLDSGAVGDERDWAAGFPPDVVLFLAMGLMPGEEYGVGDPTIGAARNAADRWSSCCTADWHTTNHEDNVQVEHRCVAVSSDNEIGGYQGRFELDYVQAQAAGFRTRVVRQDGPPNDIGPSPPASFDWRVAGLALAGLNVHLAKFKAQTSLGYQKIPTPFTPVGCLFVSACRNKDFNVDNAQTKHALQAIGFADGVNQAAIWAQSKNIDPQIGNSESNIKNDEHRCLLLAEEPTVKQQEARIVGWDTDGIWIEWVVVGGDVGSTDDWEVLVLVFGDATLAPGGVMHTGTQILRQADRIEAY